ncbi:hypothetical protein ACTNCI_11795 [Mitsuokella jalaludinii]|uniref:hypothetical protein n=1 Tax=Mitsuokella jalaludinii TaxID=187979 RepID=UPI003F88D47D
MSKMENLGDFSDFRLSAPRALFGIVPSGEAESLATQGIAVFGKNRKTCGLFDPQKGFLLFAVYHLGKILSTSVKMDQ